MNNSVDNYVENVKNSVNSHFCKVKNSAKHSFFCEYTGKYGIYITIIGKNETVKEMMEKISFCSKKANIVGEVIDPKGRLW